MRQKRSRVHHEKSRDAAKQIASGQASASRKPLAQLESGEGEHAPRPNTHAPRLAWDRCGKPKAEGNPSSYALALSEACGTSDPSLISNLMQQASGSVFAY